MASGQVAISRAFRLLDQGKAAAAKRDYQKAIALLLVLVYTRLLLLSLVRSHLETRTLRWHIAPLFD